MSHDFEFEGEIATAQADNAAKAVEFANLYTAVFVSNDAGRQLLAHWTQALNKRVPVNATINDYVAIEAQRAFVQDIHNQIAIARTGLIR
jgi:hypothetical protein